MFEPSSSWLSWHRAYYDLECGDNWRTLDADIKSIRHSPPPLLAGGWKWPSSHKCNFMDFVLSVKYFREDLWSRTFYSVFKWRHESGTVGATPSRSPQPGELVTRLSQYPRCLVNNLSRITDKCSFIRIHVISPDIWRQLCFTRRGGEHFLFVQRAAVFVIFGPTHPTALIWSDRCPPFSGIIQKTNLTLYKSPVLLPFLQTLLQCFCFESECKQTLSPPSPQSGTGQPSLSPDYRLSSL